MADNTSERVEQSKTERTGFGTTAGTNDRNLPENDKDRLDEKLDNAVDETFPGSDPVSVKITK